MPYSRRNPLATYLERRRGSLQCLDQVANRPDSLVTNLMPATSARADAVKAAWAPTTPGQKIPMLGERVDAEPDDDC